MYVKISLSGLVSVSDLLGNWTVFEHRNNNAATRHEQLFSMTIQRIIKVTFVYPGSEYLLAAIIQ